MWSKGQISGYVYHVKHFDERSKFGINGGRISKMSISKDKRLLYSYDRGCDVDNLDEKGKEIFAKLLHRFDRNQREKSR